VHYVASVSCVIRESPLSALSFVKEAGMMEMWQNFYAAELF